MISPCKWFLFRPLREEKARRRRCREYEHARKAAEEKWAKYREFQSDDHKEKTKLFRAAMSAEEDLFDKYGDIFLPSKRRG